MLNLATLVTKPKTPVGPMLDESAGSCEPLTLDGVVFPRDASARIRTMSKEQRFVWEVERLKCRTNPLFLSDVLGLDLQENPHRALFAQLLRLRGSQFPLANLDAVHKKMVLWPRGTAKTSSIRVLITQVILNYPNIRICFLTGGDQLAKRQLAALKQVFERPTDRFKYLFPEFCTKSIQDKRTGKWRDVAPSMGSAHQFSVPARSSTVFAEPTAAISTARSVKSGQHFDFLFVDDLVNDQNYSNAGALQKCYDQYLDTLPLLDPTGYLIMTGTRYSFGDTYERIMDAAKAAGELSVWKFSVRDCWSKGTCSCTHADVFHDRDVNIVEPPCTFPGCGCMGFVGDGIRGVLFPQCVKKNGDPLGHTILFLEQTRAEQGESKFANQYLNEPIAASQQQFTETMIGAQTLFEQSQMPPRGADIFIAGDLGYSVEDNRDESVLWVFMRALPGCVVVFRL